MTCQDCLGVQAVCVECGKCMRTHCNCDPCQHGKSRFVACGFCNRDVDLNLNGSTRKPDDVLGLSILTTEL